MTIVSSGTISMSSIQTEFGGSNPIGLGEYYAGGGLVPSGTTGTYGAVPSSGAIGIQNFYGTSNVVAWYYMIAPSGGSSPLLTGMQPISSGSLVGTLRIGSTYYIFILDTAGVISHTTTRNSYLIEVGTMNDGNGHALADDRVPVMYRWDNKGIARIDTDATIVQSITSNENQSEDLALGGCSPSTYQAFYNRAQLYNADQGWYIYWMSMVNFQTGTAKGVNYVTNGADNYWGKPRDYLSLTDASFSYQLVGWSGSPSGTGIMKLHKTTCTPSGSNGFHISGFGANGWVSDPSGNMYMSGNTGKIVKLNSTITSATWCFTYTESGVSPDTHHIAYYDGYLYAVQAGRPSTGALLMKINPSDGSVVWSVKMNSTFLNTASGISVTANGVVVIGKNNDSPAYGVIFNYPIAGGVSGSYNAGALVLTTATVSASSTVVTITNPGYPSISSANGYNTFTGSTFTATAFPTAKSSY